MHVVTALPSPVPNPPGPNPPGPPLPGPPLPNRASATRDWVRALDYTATALRRPDVTLALLVAEQAARHGDRPALIGETATLTYAGLAARSAAFSRFGQSIGLRHGDAVAVLMENCPDYVAIWLGLSRLGCVVALLNTHIAGDGLVHCIRAAGARHIIAGVECADALTAVAARLAGARCWVAGDAPGHDQLDAALAAVADAPDLAVEHPPVAGDPALLIYTSGTTGLPKAANVSHARVVEWACWFAGMMNAQPEDRLYDCLPMYHSVGGVVAVGAMLVRGGSVVIRRRFSASRFWADVTATGCTIFQYIGELCRYLVQSPADPQEQAHRLRLCCGNGMNGAVWEAFQARFAMPRILEFYAATEGSVSLYNCEGKPGAIGRVPPFLADRFPVALLRCDAETGVPLRDADGRCIAAAPGEPGEAVGRIAGEPGEGAAVRAFEGYTDAAASRRKILHDVFRLGDRWFRTGDLMRRDAAGFYYFVDRLGDTYRWKGENVSTAEVAAILATCPGVADAAVFGVTVPGREGRAGMAALVPATGFDLATLAAHAAAGLPEYARPVFVRICERLDMTGTFKLQKAKLAREGFSDAADPVWILDRAAGCFIPFDTVAQQRLAQGDRTLV